MGLSVPGIDDIDEEPDSLPCRTYQNIFRSSTVVAVARMSCFLS
jgi:hypothetical protein